MCVCVCVEWMSNNKRIFSAQNKNPRQLLLQAVAERRATKTKDKPKTENDIVIIICGKVDMNSIWQTVE